MTQDAVILGDSLQTLEGALNSGYEIYSDSVYPRANVTNGVATSRSILRAHSTSAEWVIVNGTYMHRLDLLARDYRGESIDFGEEQPKEKTWLDKWIKHEALLLRKEPSGYSLSAESLGGTRVLVIEGQTLDAIFTKSLELGDPVLFLKQLKLAEPIRIEAYGGTGCRG